MIARVCAAPLENSQSITNTIWSLRATVELSPEDLSAVFKERFFAPQSFSFLVFRDGKISADTAKYNPHLSKHFGLHPITSFVTMSDQHALFTNACNLVKSYQGVTSSVDLPSIDEDGEPILSFTVTIDGDARYFRYKPSDRENGSACHVHHLMALLRRNLPSSFDILFNHIHIEKLPTLPDGKADQYGRCDVHNEWLKLGTVPVTYGLEISNDNYVKAQAKSFPRANTTLSGGCVVHPGRRTKSMTLYCESCRWAEAKWSKKNTLQQGSAPNTSTRR